MSERKKSIVESLWFTVVMSIVSLAMLGEKAFALYSGDTRSLIVIPIWLVIAYHFISVTYHSWKHQGRQA